MTQPAEGKVCKYVDLAAALEEKRTKLEYPGQVLLTLEELAKVFNLSYSRLRSLVREEGAPPPTYKGRCHGNGRVKDLYDQCEVINYFLSTFKQLNRRVSYTNYFVSKGLIKEK